MFAIDDCMYEDPQSAGTCTILGRHLASWTQWQHKL